MDVSNADDDIRGSEESAAELAPGVRVPWDALRFSYARSSGPGGQHVNKRSTRATLRVPIREIPLDERARLRLRRMAGPSRLVDGEIVLSDGSRRSQKMNAQACLHRLGQLVAEAQLEPKERKPTKPSRSAKARRVDEKKKRGQTKRLRKPPEA